MKTGIEVYASRAMKFRTYTKGTHLYEILSEFFNNRVRDSVVVAGHTLTKTETGIQVLA